MNELVALAFGMFHAPCLEGMAEGWLSQWATEGAPTEGGGREGAAAGEAAEVTGGEGPGTAAVGEGGRKTAAAAGGVEKRWQ